MVMRFEGEYIERQKRDMKDLKIRDFMGDTEEG